MNLSEAVELQHTRALRYQSVRARSLSLCASLSAEDQCVQSMPDASPAKWHLGHTTWFFETVVLQAFAPDHLPGYTLFDPLFHYLFNSYYEALGPRQPRAQRGLLTRPELAQVHAYRAHVDAAMRDLLQTPAGLPAALWDMVELGLQHEQQHQELLLTDLLHLFSCNPLLPAWHAAPPAVAAALAAPAHWVTLEPGICRIGHDGAGFAFDNEGPQHEVLVHPFAVSSRLVTCGDYLGFVEAGGYQDAQWWLSDGWSMVQQQGLQYPAYWLAPGDARAPADHWQCFGLHGVQRLDPEAALVHVSFYEAAAYAEWAGARLPTEFEWECAFDVPGMQDMLGQVWQWTRSAYQPYPGFRPRDGAVREYNGKFMVGQQVLRGSSRATPPGHGRKTYRNFFPPAARWQFSGVRLAKDLS